MLWFFGNAANFSNFDVATGLTNAGSAVEHIGARRGD
jgi:hypothetical protein